MIGVRQSDGVVFLLGGTLSNPFVIEELIPSRSFSRNWDMLHRNHYPIDIGQHFSWNTEGTGALQMRDDFTAGFYVIHYDGINYVIELPIGSGFNTYINWVPYSIYTVPYIVPDSRSLQILGATHGIGDPNDPPSIDLEGVITLLFEILAELQFQSDLLTELLQDSDGDSELLGELSIQSQYQICLFAFLSGMVLFSILMSCLRLQ